MPSESMDATNRPSDATSAIRVLFFDHTAALGGGEIALLNLVRFLNPQMVKPFVLLGADGPLVKQLGPKVDTYIWPLPSGVADRKKDTLGISTLFRIREILGVLAYVWRLAKFIRKNDIDIVHTNSLKADIIGGMAARLALRPVVWHVRDRIDEDYLPRPVVRIFRLLSRVIPSYVIANSAATLRTILPSGAEYPGSGARGVARDDRIAVVHDGTLTVPARDTETQSNDLFQIGLIGRISPWKGQHIFLRAAAHVSKKFPNARFVIVGAPLFGEEEYEQAVKDLPGQLGIEDVVEFTGFRSDIEQVISGLDLVAHASVTGEPFGQVIIEGMAAGKPVVATNGGGVPEIVQDGSTGILVPMGDVQAMADAICEIVANPARGRAMGIMGRQRVQDFFTVELTAGKVEAVYRKILRRQGDRPPNLQTR